MKIIKEADPDKIASIDKSSSIIICTPPEDKNVIETEFPDIFSITLTQDLNLSLGQAISQHIISMDYNPRIKMLIPSGIKMCMEKTTNGKLVNFFSNIYCSYNTLFIYDSMNNQTLIGYMLKDFNFTLYIDVIQMRKKMPPLILPKGEPIIDVYFSWYIQTKFPIPNIENIYYIKDTYIYQELPKSI